MPRPRMLGARVLGMAAGAVCVRGPSPAHFSGDADAPRLRAMPESRTHPAWVFAVPQRRRPCLSEDMQIRGEASASVRGGGGAPPPVQESYRKLMMTLTTLIDPATLASRLADPGLVVIDCRFSLDDVDVGRAGVCGATHPWRRVRASGSRSVRTQERHQRPPSAARSGGVGGNVRTAWRRRRRPGRAYDQDSGIFASRLWWLLRWLGHDAVAVLDGGFAAWLAEGRPTSTARAEPAPRDFTGGPRPELLADVDEVSRHLGQTDWRLLDARAPERFRGDSEPLDKAAGHIPGAANRFYKGNLDERGRFRPAGGTAGAARTGRPAESAPDHVDFLLRVGRHGVPQPARAGTRRPARRKALCGLVERVVERSVEADSEGETRKQARHAVPELRCLGAAVLGCFGSCGARCSEHPTAGEKIPAPAATPERGHADPSEGVSVSSRRGWGPAASERRSYRCSRSARDNILSIRRSLTRLSAPERSETRCRRRYCHDDISTPLLSRPTFSWTWRPCPTRCSRRHRTHARSGRVGGNVRTAWRRRRRPGRRLRSGFRNLREPTLVAAALAGTRCGGSP